MFTVYILYSATLDRFYIGFTGTAIEVRLQKHLANHRGFTGKECDWIVVFTEIYNDKKTAMFREKEIKGWKSRRMIEKLISSI